MTDLTATPIVVHPDTGEVIDLATATAEQLGDVKTAIRALEDRARHAKRLLDEHILAMMDRQAKWTLHAGSYKLTGQSPAPKTEIPDPAALKAALSELVDQGVLDAGAVDTAVETVITYKPSVRGLNALRKHPAAAPVIEAHEQQVDPVRRVSVSMRPAA